MKREFLQELKLEDEIIEKIMTEHGKTVNSTKKKLDESEEKLKATTEKVTALETQSEEMKKLLGESEKFKEESEAFKNKYSDLETKFNSELEIKNKEIENVLKKSLVKERFMQVGAKHIDLLMPKINFDDVKVDNGELSGFDTQLESIKTNYVDLFTTKENQQQGNVGGDNPPPANAGEIDLSFMDKL
jgi:predicted RNase H-like nuclease (RuvC/YqgF family)